MEKSWKHHQSLPKMVLKLASKQLEVQLNTSTTTAPPISAKTDIDQSLPVVDGALCENSMNVSFKFHEYVMNVSCKLSFF